jgi:hypothetical protein
MSEKKQSIGGIWKKQTAKGEVLSIQIGDKRYTAWPNGFKKDKQPDYRIFEDTWKPESKQEVSHTPKNVMDGNDLPF